MPFAFVKTVSHGNTLFTKSIHHHLRLSGRHDFIVLSLEKDDRTVDVAGFEKR